MIFDRGLAGSGPWKTGHRTNTRQVEERLRQLKSDIILHITALIPHRSSQTVTSHFLVVACSSLKSREIRHDRNTSLYNVCTLRESGVCTNPAVTRAERDCGPSPRKANCQPAAQRRVCSADAGSCVFKPRTTSHLFQLSLTAKDDASNLECGVVLRTTRFEENDQIIGLRKSPYIIQEPSNAFRKLCTLYGALVPLLLSIQFLSSNIV